VIGSELPLAKVAATVLGDKLWFAVRDDADWRSSSFPSSFPAGSLFSCANRRAICNDSVLVELIPSSFDRFGDVRELVALFSMCSLFRVSLPSVLASDVSNTGRIIRTSGRQMKEGGYGMTIMVREMRKR